MHRPARRPGSHDPLAQGELIEQDPAPLLLLSSADTDLAAVSTLVEHDPQILGVAMRVLNLQALASPALIDHYLASTAATAQMVVVRLLGGRGHWSYGLEQLGRWATELPERQVLVLAGTADEDSALCPLSTLNPELASALSRCWREGGAHNLGLVLGAVGAVLRGEDPPLPTPQPQADPMRHDWRDDPGARVGVLLYRSLHQAGDDAWMDALLAALRQRGLSPRALWVSGLRDQAVAAGVHHLLSRERVGAVLCGTAFASVQFEEAALGAPLWDGLGVPVLQVLASTQPEAVWLASSIGLSPLDLSLQVALPELDGRVTTRIGAFKEVVSEAEETDLARLGSVLHRYQPDRERLAWIAELTQRWITLQQTPAEQRRVALVLANYPTRNSRLANGVGLDTPASTALMLQWLAEAGYHLDADPDNSDGREGLPGTGDALIARLLKGRSNDPESNHRPALGHLPLAEYLTWYAGLPDAAQANLEARWGSPHRDAGLESDAQGQPGFAIRGLAFGHVVVLIQPERGYDRDPALSYHCPDLPPTHAYLAQYLWIRQRFGAHAVVHVGKHGNLEWLPGKGLGLSSQCYPELALGPMPHLYPFIVNDPGEGSQAKRRAQAVILDHLTPPLGRAGLHGGLLELESLLDEYWEAEQLGSQRLTPLRQRLAEHLAQLQLPGLGSNVDFMELEACLDQADGYLCELKEAQIRLGLHTYGTLPPPGKAEELLLALARPPQAGLPGLTQAIAMDLGLDLDPWTDPEEAPLHDDDRLILDRLRQHPAPLLRHVGDGVALLEEHALALVADAWSAHNQGADQPLIGPPSELQPIGAATQRCLDHLQHVLMPGLAACGTAERQALLQGLEGRRIAAGPAGAPTRGRPDLLPTGRNFYSVDLRGLPTETAWDQGRRSAELLLELHLQDEGEHLRTLALTVWGTATMRNGGEDVAQALALLGVRPVWDGPTRRLVDVEVIPLSTLGRPRVDVTLRISGLFRDAFPQLVGWFNRATALVACLDESDDANPLAAASRRDGSSGRVYGSAPGGYGAGLQGLIDSGNWADRNDLAQAFLTWSAWRYDSESGAGGGLAAVPDRQGLEQRLSQVQVVLHNQDNREHDLLDSDDYYQFQGGLSAAAEALQGQAPALWFADHSRQQRPRVHRLEREVDKVLRSRLLNPRWIEAMTQHGYKGGFEMAASLDYLFAYDASTGRMPDWSYGALQAAWLDDPTVQGCLRQSNPWALRDMAERLLEAHHRGLWEGASQEQLDRLKTLVLESEALTEGF